MALSIEDLLSLRQSTAAKRDTAEQLVKEYSAEISAIDLIVSRLRQQGSVP